MNLSNDLFIRLINHRVTDTISRKEDFLTEIFCWILDQDHTLTLDFLKFVGLTELENETIQSIQTQVQLGQFGRVDAQIQSSTETLLIECKVDAPYDPTQIQRYLDHADSVNAKVLAIIPAIQSIDLELPNHPSFVDILTWEDIYSWLNESIINIDPLLQPHIESLLALLRHYRLEPIDRSIATWEDQSQEVNRKYIRTVGASINSLVPGLNALLKEHPTSPAWYSGEGAGVVPFNGTGFLYSGKGPSPRPILGHNLQIISKFGYPWGRLDFYLEFLSHRNNPTMRLQFWTGDANNTLHLLNLLGVEPNSIDGVLEHELYQNHIHNCMEYIKQELTSHFPTLQNMRTWRTQGFVGLGLCDTTDLLEPTNQTYLLKPIVHQLYKTTLKAFLDWNGWQQDFHANALP